MERKWIAALVLGIATLAGAAYAHGNKDNPTRQCIQDAKDVRKACTQVCKDDFLTSVDTCRQLNHDCAEQARADREACVADVLGALKQCIDDSCHFCGDLIEQCKSDSPRGSAERDACIDQVQVERFKCRDACRESVQLFKSLKACRDEFKADIQACKNPPTPEPQPAPQ